MESLRVQCQKLVDQQRVAFGSGIDQLDQLLTQLQHMQESLTADSTSANPPTTLTTQASNVSRLAADCRSRLPKDFKSLFTNIGKLSSKIDKTCSLDLDDLCPNPLYGSPAFLAARDAAAAAAAKRGAEADAEIGVGRGAPSASVAVGAPAPLPPPSGAEPAPDDSSTGAVAAHYGRSLERVMEESWLRDGRMDLVDTLRAECGAQHDAALFTPASASASSSPSVSPPLRLDGAHKAANEFEQLHSLVRALRCRDTEPCMQWIMEQRAQQDREIARVEEELNAARERQRTSQSESAPQRSDVDEGTDAHARPATDPLAASFNAIYGRRRVSFTGQGQRVDVASPPLPSAAAQSASAARVSSLGTRLSNLHASRDALRFLQFDLHRVRFLQILIDTEADARRVAQLARRHSHARASRKRKGASDDQHGGASSRSPVGASQKQRARCEGARPAHSAARASSSSGGGSGGVEEDGDADMDTSMGGAGPAATMDADEEEAEALAADQSSESEGEDDGDDGQREDGSEDEEKEGGGGPRAAADIDAELNALTSTARRAAGLAPAPPSGGSHSTGVTAPTSYSYHAALKYAQQFFPPFADTHMDAIRRLSGCLLFLGELTPSSSVSAPPAHPYASLFSRSGNAQLWRDVIQRAKRLCFQHINKPERDPVVVSLRACDVSLPQLLKYQSVRKLNRDIVEGVQANPEVDVGSELEYHSTFICPVTKEQCTRTAVSQRGAPTIDLPVQQQPSMHALIQHLQHQAHAHAHVHAHAQAHSQSGGASSPSSSSSASSYSNPPVVLKCGHCISQHAVEKIVKNLRLSRRFKCPTCPQEQSHTDALVLHL